MSERLLITQALDERDLLVKRINDKILKANFVDSVKNNEEKVMKTRISKEEFNKQAESSFQQIRDLITRYRKIDAAIVASNAATKIQTSYGEFTVAGAISLRNRLRGSGVYSGEADFGSKLLAKMSNEFQYQVQNVETKNKQLQSTAEGMRLSILGKDSKVRDDKPLEVVEAYVKENTTVLVDPLNIMKKMETITETRDTLLRELDTQIKVANATTFIEI